MVTLNNITHHKEPHEIAVERLLGEVERQTSAPLRGSVRRLRDQIAEDHQTLELVSRRERAFESLVEHVPEAIGRLDRDMRYQYANPAIETWTGLRPEELVGKTCRQAGSPEVLCVLWEEKVREVFASRRPAAFEFETQTRTGSKAYLRTHLVPEIRADTGEVESVMFMVKDVTDARQAQDACREALRSLESNLDCVSDGFVTYDLQWRHTFINAAAARYSRKPKEEMLGRTPWEIYPEIDPGWFMDDFRLAMETQEPRTFEGYSRLTERWFECRCNPTPEGLSVFFTDTTQRHDSQEALRASEERFRRLAETLPQLVWVTDELGRCVFQNSQWVCYTGVAMKTLEDRWRLVHPEDLPMVRKQWEAAKKTGEFKCEYRLRRQDGEYHWFLGRTARMCDGRGAPAGWVGTAMLMDELKQVQEDLQDSRDRLNLALEGGQAGFIEWDLRTDKVVWNARSFELFGYEPYSMEPDIRALRCRIHPDDLPQVDAEILTKFRDRDPSRLGEFRVVWPDGQVHWLRFTGRLTYDAQGRAETYVGIAFSITALKEAQAELRESRDRLQIALEAGQAGLMEWDLRSDSLEWNARSYELFGYAPYSVKLDIELAREGIHPQDLERIDREVENNVANRITDLQLEFRVVWPDGQEHWLRCFGRFTFDSLGTPETYVGIAFQITSLKHAEDALYRAKENAEHGNRTKDEFIAVLSHELRTPLTPALTALQLMQRDATLSSEQRDMVDMASRNVALETRLIDDLLDLTRITRGKLELHLAPVDLHHLLGHVLGIVSSELQAKNLQFTMDLGALHHHLQGDAVRLQQVFWNLLKNAIKFTPAGGKIYLRSAPLPDNRIRVTLEDTGMGIEPELLPRLFSPFEQGDKGVTRHYGGLGLGLSICKGIVDQHGGVLTGYSAGVGKGATFVVELPVSRETHAAHPRGGGGPAPGEKRRGGRILLVEDHPDSSMILAKVLRGMGYDVQQAESVASALRATEHTAMDLIISDIGLPDGSGLDLVRQLALRRPTKAIALSGFGSEEDIKRSREAGFVQHLTKPVDIAVLEEMIGRLLG